MAKNTKIREVEFDASIPPCKGAVDNHGDGGTRLLLDIPENCKPQALELAAYFLKKKLKVKIICLGTV